MLAAMDVVGNPSSVHAEGRAARAIVEKARAQVARLAGCEALEVIFTSGATEAAKLTEDDGVELCSALEHDCIWEPFGNNAVVDVSRDGVVLATERGTPTPLWQQADLVCLTA
ncbi:MAG: aminotransferase class V-fold PLP-dependent enzyme, partial [Thermohalobaculum sp.]|nr:aminotransferase class V-fold PLP-dependent enzyme [Thermohalobaculum sp.]